MEDMDLEGMDDDGGDEGADDMNEALEDMEEIDEYVQALRTIIFWLTGPSCPPTPLTQFSELPWSTIQIFNCYFFK